MVAGHQAGGVQQACLAERYPLRRARRPGGPEHDGAGLGPANRGGLRPTRWIHWIRFRIHVDAETGKRRRHIGLGRIGSHREHDGAGGEEAEVGRDEFERTLLLEQDRPPGKVAAPGPLGDPPREDAPGDGVARPALDKGGIRGGTLASLGDECRYTTGHQRHPPEAA